MREYKSQIGNVQGQMVAYQYENPIFSCRCSNGACKKRKGCYPVKTEMHGLACQVWDRFCESVEFTPSAHFENRSEIIKGVIVSKTDTLDFQDNMFLTIRETRKHKKDAWETYLKAKDCKPSKSGRYNRGSARWKAQKIIEEALADVREVKTMALSEVGLRK